MKRPQPKSNGGKRFLFFPEADDALSPNSEAAPVGSVTIYVVPHNSLLLPQVCLSSSSLATGRLHYVFICAYYALVMSFPETSCSGMTWKQIVQGCTFHCLLLCFQEVAIYLGKYRAAVVRAPRGTEDALLAVNSRVRQVAEVMSFSAESISGALSDRIPTGQPGTEWKRPFKSSLGREKKVAAL